MPTLKHVSVISVPVSDQARAKAFYAEQVGFDLINDSPFDDRGTRWVQLGPPDGQTSITLTTWFDDFEPGALRGLVLDVDDIAAVRSEMEGRGVGFTGDTYGTPWGEFAPFEDPDGNRWDLHQPAPGM